MARLKCHALRNVELTGPYFHNGGQATLEQVIQFYNRGGDRKDYVPKRSKLWWRIARSWLWLPLIQKLA